MPIDPKTKNWVGPSKSEDYLLNKSYIPQISTFMANSVSQARKELLGQELNQGLFREGSQANRSNSEMTVMGNVSGFGGLKKSAQHFGSVGGGFKGSADTSMISPDIYSPLWLTSNMNLPRDRATINAWCRSFFALNPFVHNAICLHSTYPISKLSIKSESKEVENFFNAMIEEIDLINMCVQIAQEYWLLGECFVYAELDEQALKWSRLMIYNPDYMVVNRTVIADEPNIALRPDENLKRIIFSNKPSDIAQRKQLDPYIIESVKKGKNIPLPNYSVSHLARKISPYEIRGTGLPVCVFKNLMLLDKLRENDYVQADTMVNPLTLVKIGSAGVDGFKPQPADLDAFQQKLEEAENNKNFKIITHDAVSIERIGYGQGIYDTMPKVQQLIKEIMVGLQVPSVIMDGTDITYNNGSVALQALRDRYLSFRQMLSSWLKNKIFAPISHLNGFYDTKNGKKQLIIPEVEWNHMSLFDTADYITQLVSLTAGEGDQKRASLHTLYRSMGLDYGDEMRKMRKESIQNAINAKEKLALESMDLNSLRSLDDDSEIKENEDTKKQPAGNEDSGGLGESPPEGLPGLDLGSSAPPIPNSEKPPSPTPTSPVPTPPKT